MGDWSLNRGEWAEGYVFLKILGDGRIHAGTANLEPIPETYIDVKNVQKRLGSDKYVFEREKLGRVACTIVCCKNGEQYICIPSEKFLQNASKLFRIIGNKKTGNISAPDIQQFFESIDIKSIKSPPLSKDEIEKYGGKTDIFLCVRNSIDTSEEELGFSIKSHFGSNATLFNCGPGSNYLYEISGCTDKDMIFLNSLDSIDEIVSYVKESNYMKFNVLGSAPVCFSKNEEPRPIFDFSLDHIDTRLSEVISYMLLCIYGYYDKPKSKSIKDIVDLISATNPLGLRERNGASPYESMFKRLLFAAFSGMTASKIWDGKNRVTGGYLDVSEDGNILYFRALSDEQFNSYLYNTTCLDAPSKGGKYKAIHKAAKEGNNLPDIDSIKGDHGDYGYIFNYEINGKQMKVLGINFQIRFKN